MKEVAVVATMKDILRHGVGSKVILGVLMLGLVPLLVLNDEIALLLIVVTFFAALREIGWIRYSTIKVKSALLPFLVVVLIFAGFISLAWIRLDVPHGQWLTMTILLSVVATDAAAMFRGRYLDRNGIEGTRIFPKTSPSKTLEGVVSGVIAGVGAGLVVSGSGSVLGLLAIDPAVLAVVVLATPPLAVLGDYVASACKRSLGVKDFSRILGAHGGILDRIDGHLMAFTGCGALLYLLM